jgi:lipid A oxidase
MTGGRAFVGSALAAWTTHWSSRHKVGALARLEMASALAACLTVCIFAFQYLFLAAVSKDRPSGHVEYDDQRAAQIERRDAIVKEVRYRGGEALTAVYGGAQYTYPSDVRIQRPGTDLTIHNLPWEGRPFDHPIYYGVRVARWFPASSIGGMVDFTHSKVYSPMEEKARFSGSRDGRPLPDVARIEEVFHKLEFTHGHNMLTLNGLWRLPFSTPFFSPYVGAGLGVSLPHSEVQLRGEHNRTYEYQYTGPAYQVVVGLEFRIPKVSYFVEYKWTSASYRVPLHYRETKSLFSDLAHQFLRWRGGKEPEGGWATTQLASHQVISGMGYRTMPVAAGP